MPNTAGKLPVGGRSILKGCLQVPGVQPLGLLTDHTARVTMGELIHHRGAQSWGNPSSASTPGSAAVPTRPWAALQPHENSSARLCFSLLRFLLVFTCCAWFRDEDAQLVAQGCGCSVYGSGMRMYTAHGLRMKMLGL